MKQSFQYSTALLLLFLLLISSSKLSAIFLTTKQGGLERERTPKEIINGGSLQELEGSESVDELMGLEDCGNGEHDDAEEQCLKRRIIAEAHLDYIYTQHHKP
ncbi:Phytosulfokine [Parasponia andersonii]|uniref:Phytosulfokine n=1 Tax=Parasponia andersonii TaxID=3476 RepID=A0A2P5BB67_PARAD|nr:Phytosulfokine [Parasponia andersonii]